MGWEARILNSPGNKPKGMRWQTFWKLERQHNMFLRRSLEGMKERLSKLKQQDSLAATSKSSTPTVPSLDTKKEEGINEQCETDLECKPNQICQVLSEFESKCVLKTLDPHTEQEQQQTEITSNTLNEVKLVSVGGVYEIPVSLNDVLKINVILDSGAADVSIAPDVALTLIRTGTIEKSDWLPGVVYRFADGSTAKSQRFKLQSVTIGNRTFRNVTCSIANSVEAPMLLGQSVLKQLGKYTIDYKKGVMQFE